MPSFVALAAVPQLSLARDRASAWRFAKPKPKRRAGLTRRVLNLLIDRVESAVESGRLELVEHAGDVALAAGPAVHTAAYGELLAVLFAEDYTVRPPTGIASVAAPLTPERIAAYRSRAIRGEPIKRTGDLVPGRVETLALAGGANRNGSGVRITGWQHDEAE